MKIDINSTDFISRYGQNNNTERVYLHQRDAVFIFGVSGIIYTPIVLTLLILLSCVYKAYKTTLQRLTLYYVFIALLCECT